MFLALTARSRTRSGRRSHRRHRPLIELQGINLEEIAKKRNRVDDLQLQDYKVSTMHLRRILRWYRDLPVNLVLTALVHKQYPAGTDGIVGDPVEIRPALTQKLSDAIMGFCDAVWYLYTAEEKTADEDTRVARYMLGDAALPGKTRVSVRGGPGGRVKDPPFALYDLFVEQSRLPVAPNSTIRRGNDHTCTRRSLPLRRLRVDLTA